MQQKGTLTVVWDGLFGMRPMTLWWEELSVGGVAALHWKLNIQEALSWIKNQGWDFVEVETDALVAIHKIRVGLSRSAVGILAEDIRDISKRFSNIDFSFVRRSSNRVAYELARVACSMYDCQKFGCVILLRV
ncbi:unnamed protein product [Cuscuta epithymum]|uniref:RNase H type-1 domain-containing protein n=1 Tax=Cuscuta epithymum TaxID=186058 RepID=A0AAV0EGV7_9ASTE|nr:unnamed protein product [Cuscuta epithymum]